MKAGTLEIADMAARKFLELNHPPGYPSTVAFHGMARRACLDEKGGRLEELKSILAPYIAGKLRYGTFESYHCGGNGTAWLLYKGRYPESSEAVFRCADELFSRHPRTPEGFFTFPSPKLSKVIWIDAAFAVTPFLVCAGLHFKKDEWVESGFFQTSAMYDLLMDPECGLLHQSKNKNGPGIISQDHWSRGNGWGVLALTELVNVLPEGSPFRTPAVKMFKDLLRAALRVQDGEGMWHQEMTLHSPPSYVETSGTAFLLYALGAAVEHGLAEEGWYEALLKGLKGFLAYIAVDGSVHNTCIGCLSPGDGSIAAYCARPYELNDAHAHGPVILAFAQARQAGIKEI